MVNAIKSSSLVKTETGDELVLISASGDVVGDLDHGGGGAEVLAVSMVVAGNETEHFQVADQL